jgi:hypothetical protein
MYNLFHRAEERLPATSTHISTGCRFISGGVRIRLQTTSVLRVLDAPWVDGPSVANGPIQLGRVL